jgi:hypothetical protein
MKHFDAETEAAFERRLDQARVPAPRRPDYQKWVGFYLLPCQKFAHLPSAPTSLGPFLNGLAAKNRAIPHHILFSRCAAGHGRFAIGDCSQWAG